ncbi:MAG: hypothetical protein DDT26_00762 [Dehalococcoidia bacterium]|nr:hypothetical protein [Chloroflexota bacterium]
MLVELAQTVLYEDSPAFQAAIATLEHNRKVLSSADLKALTSILIAVGKTEVPPIVFAWTGHPDSAKDRAVAEAYRDRLGLLVRGDDEDLDSVVDDFGFEINW